jgi:hypothetical protein
VLRDHGVHRDPCGVRVAAGSAAPPSAGRSGAIARASASGAMSPAAARVESSWWRRAVEA